MSHAVNIVGQPGGWARGGLALGILPMALAAGLAAWGLNFGLPFLFRPDEDVMVGRAVRMVAAGSLDPLFANYPPLVFYLFAAAEWGWSRLGGDNLGGAVVADPSSAYLVARSLSAAAFAVSAGLVFAAGRRAYGLLPALTAGLAMAAAPLAVRQAHFATADGIQTMFVAGGLLAALTAGSQRGFAIAGALAGLAGASKYTGGLVMVAVVAAAWTSSPRTRNLKVALVAAAIAFAVPSAVMILHPLGYLGGLGFLGRNAYLSDRGLPPGWIYHPTTTLPFGLGLGMYPLALVGIALALWRRQRPDRILLPFTAVYLLITCAGNEVFFRYELPLLPALCLLAAGVLRQLSPRLLVPAGAATALALVPSLYASLNQDRLLGREDTRAIAARWLDANLPAGAGLRSPYYGGPFYDAQEVRQNQRWVADDLAAGFLQGRYTDRFRLNPPDPDAELLASGPPWQAPLPRRPGSEPAFSVRPYRGDTPSVYDRLDSYYLPYWGFNGIDRPGPSLAVYLNR